MFSEFFVNFSILFCFTVLIFWLFTQYSNKPFISKYKSVIVGISFGVGALILTVLTAPFANGVLINNRTIFLLFGGLLGGPVSVLIIGLIIVFSREALLFTSTLSYIMMYNILFVTLITAAIAYKRPITYQNMPIYFFALTFEHILVLLIYYKCSSQGILYLVIYLIFSTAAFYVIRTLLSQLEDTSSQIKRIYQLGKMDFLTQLPNSKAAEQKIISYMNARTPFELLHIDIRNFQNINCQYRYKVGDELIILVGEILQKQLPDNGFIARIGSDQFYIVLPFHEPASAIHFAYQVDQKVRQFVFEPNNEIQLSLAIGISSYPYNTIKLEELYEKTYRALKQAKILSNHHICHYNQLKQLHKK
ncbi:GGDEF domain-containing protein [Solibacillus sp. FSL R7-0682]|jgi:diguanylate cyclase|uniref:GGDEF domain-containing protein n=1 Tax=Solibacillus sp. FSL R7-0682 TaxID=2921690 RepID=UPI0030FA7385